MIHTLFVTGTDTGVGKTTIAVGLLTLLARAGRRPVPFKPCETGCNPDPADAMRLRAAAGRNDLPLDLVCPHTFAPPVAPSVAARMAGTRISLEDLAATHRRLASEGDLVVVEGAGGLLVPYADDLLAADIAVHLGATLLIVARARLGTINHTLLTVAEARRRGLPILGVLLNATDDAGPDQPTNAAEIAHHGEVPVLGTLPRLPAGADAGTVADLLATAAPSLLDAILKSDQPSTSTDRW